MKMDKDDESFMAQLIGGFIILVAGAALGSYFTEVFVSGRDEYRWERDSVRHGAAHYVVQPDGSDKWEWIQPEKNP